MVSKSRGSTPEGENNKKKARGIRPHGTGYQWYFMKHGKDYRGTADTFQQAELDRADALKKANEGTYVAPTRMTLNQFWEREFLPTIRRTRKPSTIANYRDKYRLHIQPRFGDTLMREISIGAVNQWLTTLSTGGRADGKGGLSDTSVQNCWGLLNTVLNFAVEIEALPRNPLQKMKDKPQRSEDPEDRDWWDKPTLRAFLLDPLVQQHRLYAMVALVIDTGIRLGEVAGLLWTSIDLDAGTVTINRTRIANRTPKEEREPDDPKVLVGTPKSRKGKKKVRKIPISPEVVTALRAWRKVQMEERLRAGANWVGDKEVFTTPVEKGSRGRPGAAYTPESLAQVWERLRDRWLAADPSRKDLPRPSIHELRHSNLSLLVAMGIHPNIVKERAGHADTRMVDKTYGHVSPATHQEVADELGNELWGEPTKRPHLRAVGDDDDDDGQAGVPAVVGP